MSRNILITEIGEWLIDQALAEPDIVEMFSQACRRLAGAGVPITRARLTWPTLHPLFQAETVLWKLGEETKFEQFNHQDNASDEWLQSPMNYVLENDIDTLRRNLDGPNEQIDFPILVDLKEQGFTDYLMIATPFGSGIETKQFESGILLTWSSGRAGGFSDDDLEALKKIQRRFAAACKTAVQQRIASNITETYLGKHAGTQVLNGNIKLGDGRETQAVVWYSDMRNSTALADTMPPEDFLELLNDYFASTAGPAIDMGGEVLDFIGDAVLAIFPFEDDAGKQQAIRCATMALEDSLSARKTINQRRESEGKVPFEFGVGLNIGKLMFGNIGVASRLAFSVIGPTINEVERIETLTKTMGTAALASKQIAEANPDKWKSIGAQRLNGVSHQCELFALDLDHMEAVAVPAELSIEKASAH